MSSCIIKLIDFISAEWLLKKRSNGGSTILLRSLFISVILFTAVLLFINIVDPTRVHTFSLVVIREQLVDKITWFGVTFASVYAALYARFSSQWSYLANLYNSIKQASSSNNAKIETISEWKAGFIEDAEFLHLACKENFASIIYHWGKDEKVREKYISLTPGGEMRLNKLMNEIEVVYTKSCNKYI